MEENNYLAGDVKYSDQFPVSEQKGEEFLHSLQKLMLKYGIIKVDVCFDALKMLPSTKELYNS